MFFVVVVTGFFLNKIGLPEFAKEQFVREFREYGWEADFSRLRLRWHHGIVADDLHLRRSTNGFAGPNLFVSRAECGLDFGAFMRLKLDVDSFKMADARLLWPMARRGRYQPPFRLDGVDAELYFRPNDHWELTRLNGELLGASVHFHGTITNGSLIRDWRIGERRRPRGDPLAVWEEIVRTVAQLRFAGERELKGTFRGDAADLSTLDAYLTFKAPGVVSPWGAGTNLFMTARLFPGGPEGVQADFFLTAGEVSTEFVEASEFRMNLEVEPRFTNAWPTNVNLAIELKGARTQWGTGDYALLTSRLTPCPTNSALLQTDWKGLVKGFSDGKGRIESSDIHLLVTHPPATWLPGHVVGSGEFRQAKSDLAQAASISVRLEGNLPDATNWTVLNTNLTWPERIRSVPFRAEATLDGVSARGASAETLVLDADWQWPSLRLKSEGALYGGAFNADAGLDVESRQLGFKGRSTFDVHEIAPLLGTNAQKFLKSYSWDAPPVLEAAGSITLPSLTNVTLDFGPEVLASLSLGGSFAVGPAAYKGIPFTAAKGPFAMTNNIWRLDALELKRPEGELHGAYTSMPATKEFHWKLRSSVDPRAFKSLFVKEIEQQVFDFFEFTTPPWIEGEVWGHWRNPERIGIHAAVRGTDFAFRKQSIGECSAELRYTNLFLSILNPQITRPGEKGVAPGVGIDFKNMRVWLTNAFGNLDPLAVARCIGPKTAKVMEDYRFDKPPTTRVNGSVDLKRGSDEDDLHFEVQGGMFHWKDFRFQELSVNIDWIGRTMVLTNMQGIFHGGRAEGHAHFAFPRKKGAEFSFKLTAVEVDFHSFMSDLTGKSNRLEGMLNGELTVVFGNTAQPNSWMGYGNVYLRDGLIWDIPVFGLFSPILNAIVPGVGNSRAKQGIAKFDITNSVIWTTDLDIQATGMRMHFNGTVDFERRIDSRVEAELLRDLPGIGVVVSKILWPVTKLFEYRVTGTLSEPKAEPLYIVPKILLLPFMPFKVLKDLVTEDPKPPPPKAPEAKNAND